MSPGHALALFLLPATAAAQTGLVAHSDLSRGATLPPTSAAWADQATATSVNPAGLTFLGGPELFYAHERAGARGQVVNGLYLGDSLWEGLGLGFSTEWVRGEGPDYRKTSYGFSFGLSALSLGLAYNTYSSSESADLNGLSSLDLGLSSRPFRRLAFGLVAKNLDAPSQGAVTLARRYQLSLGLRPSSERFTLGIDYLLEETRGLRGGRLTYSGRAELFRGLWAGAGVSHGLGATDELFLQLSLTFDAPHLGLTYSGSGAAAGADHLVALRASAQNYRALSFSAGKVAVVDPGELLGQGPGPLAELLGAQPEDPFLRLTRLLHQAAADPELRGVVLKLQPLEGGLGKAEELRGALLRLKAAGKKVLVLLSSASDAEYLTATAADRIYALPESVLLLDGLSASATFLGGSMDKAGVHWDVARVGAYKNAPDALTRAEMSPEQREAMEALLDTDFRAYQAVVTRARSVSPEAFRAALAEGLKTPRRAQALKLIDQVIEPSQLEELVRELFPGAQVQELRQSRVRQERWGRKRQIAIVPVIGNITGGKSEQAPFGLSQTAGAETVTRALRQAAEDPGVSAIVVRVDSGGGDGLASDLIYREVLAARKKKPVVASMGDLAASGGYYAAMGASEIFAQPTTITGSIGVFVLKPALKELAERLGARRETLQRGELAGLFDFYRPWTEAERASAQAWVEAFYDDFVTEVARSRKLPKEEVDRVARGRVWSGEDALSRRLVDRLGGLLDAVESARRHAGIPEGEEIELRVVREPGGFLAGAGGGVLARLLPPSSSRTAPGLKTLAHELGIDRLLDPAPRVMAELEWRLSVR